MTHRIALLDGWYQVVEACDDGTITPIGSFRTAKDAQDWLNTHLRMQSGAEVFKVGYSEPQCIASTETPAATRAREST